MADRKNEIREILASIAHDMAREEISRADIAEENRESLEKEISEAATEKLVKELDRNANSIREEVRAELQTLSKRERKEQKALEKAGEKTFQRFNRNFRFQHMVLFSSVIFLILTGMPMKFNEWSISLSVVDMLGGGEAGVGRLRLIHRIAASGLIFFFVYHMFYNIFFRDGRRDFWLMIPRPRDLFDVIQMLKYFFGLSKEKPRFDRFSYIEKFDYWAVYWGCVIMIGTGAVLWFNEIIGRYLPKWGFDLAKIIHSDEALLATLALVVWHFYNVHFNPDRFPGSLLWWHGRMTEEEMLKEHPLELERIVEEEKKSRSEG